MMQYREIFTYIDCAKGTLIDSAGAKITRDDYLPRLILSDEVMLYTSFVNVNNENGKITLIASTTENPYFYIYSAVLSRCTVFEFKPVDTEDIKEALSRAKEKLDFPIILEEDAAEHLAASACGDVRKALNSLEVAVVLDVV